MPPKGFEASGSVRGWLGFKNSVFATSAQANTYTASAPRFASIGDYVVSRTC